ncbi:MAG: MATE family efflux transporter [Bacteroidales bacterium]|jgi:putative MATE family efflux protein|nr:MATE family efflux transporter [Bacteroidales bacterium]
MTTITQKKETSLFIELGTQKIGKLLIQYALPAIVAMTASAIYNITDSIFIGHGAGELAISGLALTFPIMNLAAAFGSLVGAGAAALMSLRLGQKDYVSAQKILGNLIILNVAIGILFSIITLMFLTPLLMFFGASKDTLPYAKSFLQVILLGNIVTHLYLGLNSMLRSLGRPTKSMFCTILTVCINLVLNPLFIFGFGWGIKGSAIATVIAQTIVLIWQFTMFFNKKNEIRIERKIFHLDLKIIKDIFSIGMAPFFMNLASCVIVIIINKQVVLYGGDLAVGAYGIINRVSFLFVLVVLGLNQGMQPIAGYNYGAKLYKRVSEVLKKTIFLATIVMIIGFAIILLFPEFIASLFTKSEEQIAITVNGLRYVFMFFPIIGFQMVASNFFQSIGVVKKAIFLSLTRQVIFLIPLLLVLPLYFGITGVWLSMPIADFVSTILTAILLGLHLKKFKTQK